MNDIFNNVQFVPLLDPQSINDTDTVSLVLDTRAFGRKAVAVYLGNLTGVDSDSNLKINLQESDTTTGTDFTAVAVADMIRSTTGLDSTSTAGRFGYIDATTEDVTVVKAEYIGTKRYIRVQLDFTTGTGGITGCPVAVLGVLSDAKHGPASGPAPITAA